jgi:hypothetical protein
MAIDLILKKTVGVSLSQVDLIASILRDPIGTARAILDSIGRVDLSPLFWDHQGETAPPTVFRTSSPQPVLKRDA